MQSKGDPGYWSTARLLIECGLCIALQVRPATPAVFCQGLK